MKCALVSGVARLHVHLEVRGGPAALEAAAADAGRVVALDADDVAHPAARTWRSPWPCPCSIVGVASSNLIVAGAAELAHGHAEARDAAVPAARPRRQGRAAAVLPVGGSSLPSSVIQTVDRHRLRHGAVHREAPATAAAADR